jgi:putative membrane protein
VIDELSNHEEVAMRTRNRMAGLALVLGTAAILGGCERRDDSRADTAAPGGMAADTAGATTAPAGGGMTDANIAAVLDAANESDSAFGALAVRKGRSADVKQFGRLMMGEHHALRQQGQQLVKKLNVTPQPPANFDLPDQQQEAMKDLESKSGADFDRAYIDHEVEYHQQVLETAQNALGQAQNPELKALIQKAAPVIQKHLDRAKEIQKTLGT